MKKFVMTAVSAALLSVAPVALSAEASFNPSTQFYDTDGNGIIRLWGVPEASGQPLVANPDYGWPTEMAMALWYSTILKAHQMNQRVVVGYDPVNLEIWYIAKPRP